MIKVDKMPFLRPWRRGMVVLAAAALVGCSDDPVENTSVGTQEAKQGSLSFVIEDVEETVTRAGGSSVSVGEEMRRIDFEDAGGLDVCLQETTVDGVNPVQRTAETRGALKTAIDADFGCSAFTAGSSVPNLMYNARVSSAGTPYVAVPYSTQGESVTFYAVYPYAEASDTYQSYSGSTVHGTPYVDFTVRTAVTDQTDLMTATTTQTKTSVGTWVVPLTFRHALTAVKFAVGSDLAWNKTITGIEISGVYGSGRCKVDDNTWTGQKSPSTYSLTGLNVSTSKAINSELTSGEATFLMLPQTCPAGSKIVISFSDGSTISASLTNAKWAPGTTKTYKISSTATSNWEWVITASSPAASAYTATQSGNYTITSYRLSSSYSPVHS